MWIALCSVLAFVLPAMASNVAEQLATTTQASTILLVAQDNTTNVTGWSFSGAPGSMNSTPVNSDGDGQVLNAPWKPVVLLNNTGVVTYKIILNAAEFNDTGVAQVANEKYNVTWTNSSPADPTQITGSLTAGTDMDTGQTVDGNSGQMSLWLKLTFGGSAAKMASSQFSVLGETQ